MLHNYSVTKNPDNRIHLFDPVALINDGFDGGYRASSKPRRPTKSYGNFEDAKIMKMNNDEIRFDVVDKRYEVLSFDDAHDDVEVCTPRLWKQTNNDTTRPRPKDEQFEEEEEEEEEEEKLSSRTKEIARGRRELMDMVKDLPESSYELSLKDLVEYKSEITEAHTNKVDEEKTVLQESNSMVRDVSMEKTKKKKNKKLGRTKSANNDKVLLKTSVFPSFFGSKKKKKQGLNGGDSFKAGSGAKVGSGEKDWWKRKSCISSESDRSNGLSSKSGSGDSSSSSSSSSLSSTTIARRGMSFSTVCCLFNGKKTAK